MPKINLLTLIFAALFSATAWASDIHGDEEIPITEVELSEAALQNYDIKTTTIAGEKITLPATAVVASQDEFFAYIREGKHFRQIEIHPTARSMDTISFEYHTEEPSSEFVTNGAPYLRIVFLNNANPITGHAH